MASTIPNSLLYKFVPKAAMPLLTDFSCDLKRKGILSVVSQHTPRTMFGILFLQEF